MSQSANDNPKRRNISQADLDRADAHFREKRELERVVEGELLSVFDSISPDRVHAQRDSERTWEIIVFVPTEATLSSALRQDFLEWGCKRSLDVIADQTGVEREQLRLLFEIESDENVSRNYGHTGNRMRGDGRVECQRMAADFFDVRADDNERKYGKRF